MLSIVQFFNLNHEGSELDFLLCFELKNAAMNFKNSMTRGNPEFEITGAEMMDMEGFLVT